MLVPVPEPTKPELPPSVVNRMDKMFNTEPKQEGIVKDVTKVKNTLEEKKAADAAKLEAMKKDAPVLPLPQVAKPSLVVEEVKKETKAEAPKLPEPVKPVEAAKPEAIKPPEPLKAAAQPPVLPLPMPALPVKADGAKPVEPVKAPEPVKGIAVEKPAEKLPEKLPPAELPAVKADVKPVTLPKAEIAPLPKMDGKEAPPSLPLPPELPKPPVAVDAKKEPAKAEVKPVEAVKVEAAKPAAPPPALPGLPKLPELPAAPAKPALPPLTAITGDKAPNSKDILQPKEAIDAKPLIAPAAPVVTPPALPGLPKLPGAPAAGNALPGLPPLPGAPLPKPAEVKVTTPARAAVSAPVLPLPAPAKVEAAPAKPAEVKTEAKPADAPAKPAEGKPEAKADTKPEASADAKPAEGAKAETPAAPSAGDGKLSKSISYSKAKTDLSDAAKSDLAGIADAVKQSQGSVRIVAYAGGTAEEASVAKRTSLARALQIRAYLISKGVNQLNISVQALGNKVSGADAERADIFVK